MLLYLFVCSHLIRLAIGNLMKSLPLRISMNSVFFGNKPRTTEIGGTCVSPKAVWVRPLAKTKVIEKHFWSGRGWRIHGAWHHLLNLQHRQKTQLIFFCIRSVSGRNQRMILLVELFITCGIPTWYWLAMNNESTKELIDQAMTENTTTTCNIALIAVLSLVGKKHAEPLTA